MSTLQAITLDQVVDTDRYPLSDPESPECEAVVARARSELDAVGCTVLPDFIRPALHEVLRQECAAIAPQAYFDVETVNVYNIDVDADLPEDHPGRRTFQRGNAFVARDRVPADALIGQALRPRAVPALRGQAASRCPACTSSPTRCRDSCSTSCAREWSTPGISTPTSTRSAC